MKQFPALCALAFALFLLVPANAVSGFTLTGGAWPAGSAVAIQLELGSTNVTLQDGLGTWNNSAADALALWNQNLDFIQFTPVFDSNAPKGSPDGLNSVFFSNTIFGEGFGKDTLAVTVYWNSAQDPSIRIEADVVFNNAQKFNSYRGNLQAGTYDFHRVALHEFGHVLGLGHVMNYPAGQALMEPVITNLDHLTSDDITGAIFLYGYRIVSSLVVDGFVVGDSFEYTAIANNNPFSFSATGLPPGLRIEAATGKITGVCTKAGTYLVTITAHGFPKDVSAIVTMTFAPAEITSGVAVGPVDVGTPLSYTITGPNSPTSFDATGIPPGLSLDSATGVISGIPTINGYYTTAVTAHGPSYDASGIVYFTIQPHYKETVASLEVGPDASQIEGLIPDPLRSRLYVLTDTGIVVVDTIELSITKTIVLGGFVEDGAISSDGSTLWFTLRIGNSEAAVSGMDLTNLSILPAIPNGPFRATSIRSGINHKIYLVNDNGLFQVDTITGITRELKARSGVPLTWWIDVSPDHRNLYLAFQDHYPGMIEHYDIAGEVPVLVEERAALGYVGRAMVSADGQTLFYDDFEQLPADQFHLFAVPTSDLGASPKALEPPFFSYWFSSHDSSVVYKFLPPTFTRDAWYFFDFVSTTSGLPIDRWTLPHPYFEVADDGKGSYLFTGDGSVLRVYSLSSAVAPPPPAAPKTLLNVSTRTIVGTDDQQLIAGFIITGASTKKIALRSIGPSLPLLNPISDPSIEVHDSGGALVASNDNWNTQRDELTAAGLAPWDEHESGMIVSLEPGAYTAVAKNVNGARGVGLVEIYDLSSDEPVTLANLSTRGQVGTNDDVLIGGFIIGGSDPTRVILRAIGPSLYDQGVSGFLVDPVLELHGGNGELILQNDDWRATQEAEIIATGLPPKKDQESAILATLQPGSYTAIVRGQNSTSGVALVEVYNLDSATSK